jgi:hypothetical protein
MKKLLILSALLIQMSVYSQSIEGKWFLKATNGSNPCAIGLGECFSSTLYRDSTAIFDKQKKCYYTLCYTYKNDGTYHVETRFYPLNNAKGYGQIASSGQIGTWSKESNGMIKVIPNGAVVPPFFIYRLEMLKPRELRLYQQM